MTSERPSEVIVTTSNLGELVYALQDPLREAARSHRGGRTRFEDRPSEQAQEAVVLMRRATGDGSWELDRGRARPPARQPAAVALLTPESP